MESPCSVPASSSPPKNKLICGLNRSTELQALPPVKI